MVFLYSKIGFQLRKAAGATYEMKPYILFTTVLMIIFYALIFGRFFLIAQCEFKYPMMIRFIPFAFSTLVSVYSLFYMNNAYTLCIALWTENLCEYLPLCKKARNQN